MQKDSWLKRKRALKKMNTNKEDNKREQIKQFSKDPNPYTNVRSIRHHINNEYGIKVMNKDVANCIKGKSGTYYSDIKTNYTELNDEQFEEAVNREDNRISGNINGFVLKTFVNEAINTKSMSYDTLFTRDKTKWNSNKLKSKQRKFDRDIKNDTNYIY